MATNCPIDVHELAGVALFSLPADYPIAHLGDDWLRVRDVHEALTTGTVDGAWVVEVLHLQTGGSLLRPDLCDDADAVLAVQRVGPACRCGHDTGGHAGAYGACRLCGFGGCGAYRVSS